MIDMELTRAERLEATNLIQRLQDLVRHGDQSAADHLCELRQPLDDLLTDSRHDRGNHCG